QQILDGVWGFDWYGDVRTVDVHIAQVRKKLGDACTITTVRGVGYRLESTAQDQLQEKSPAVANQLEELGRRLRLRQARGLGGNNVRQLVAAVLRISN